MKINTKILSVPPYISTAWTNISAIHVIDGHLHVTLKSGSTIDIPKLDGTIIEKIFEAHAKFLEKELPATQKAAPESPFSFALPLPTDGFNFGGMLEHNQKLASSPNLPPEAIEKIREMSKSLDIHANHMDMPTAEPHCNCPYCQIARIMNEEHKETEEEVSDEELTFREWNWDVKQVDDKLFLVTSPSNKDEQYRVFLGDPLGCTCGEKNCEHIRTVLNS